jgi:hypothetical protein
MKLVGCSSDDLLCTALFSNPLPPTRPHPLPQPLSQPHASTEANSPPLTALEKPKAPKPAPAPHKKPQAPLARGSVLLELATDAEAETDADAQYAVIPSNHYGLLTHFSRFVPHCERH